MYYFPSLGISLPKYAMRSEKETPIKPRSDSETRYYDWPGRPKEDKRSSFRVFHCNVCECFNYCQVAPLARQRLFIGNRTSLRFECRVMSVQSYHARNKRWSSNASRSVSRRIETKYLRDAWWVIDQIDDFPILLSHKIKHPGRVRMLFRSPRTLSVDVYSVDTDFRKNNWHLVVSSSQRQPISFWWWIDGWIDVSSYVPPFMDRDRMAHNLKLTTLSNQIKSNIQKWSSLLLSLPSPSLEPLLSLLPNLDASPPSSSTDLKCELRFVQ